MPSSVQIQLYQVLDLLTVNYYPELLAFSATSTVQSLLTALEQSVDYRCFMRPISLPLIWGCTIYQQSGSNKQY